MEKKVVVMECELQCSGSIFGGLEPIQNVMHLKLGMDPLNLGTDPKVADLIPSSFGTNLLSLVDFAAMFWRVG